MATTTAAVTSEGGEQRTALRGITWETFLKVVGKRDNGPSLLAYNRGVLEIMSPGPSHEDFKTLLGRLIEVVTEELDMPCKGMGSTLWLRPEEEKGLEPDACYMLTAAKVEASGHRSKDMADYPFPDLAVEVDMKRGTVDRAEIYAAMGVPEVWRFDGRRLRVDRLREDGTYEPAGESLFLPVATAEVVRWLPEEFEADQNAWARRLRAWVRAEVAPRRAGGF